MSSLVDFIGTIDLLTDCLIGIHSPDVFLVLLLGKAVLPNGGDGQPEGAKEWPQASNDEENMFP